MYINLFNWLVKIRTIKVSVLYDMHERSNSTFWEISIRWQRHIVKVRIFEKVKKCCSGFPPAEIRIVRHLRQLGLYLGPARSFPAGGGALGQGIHQPSSPRLAWTHWSCRVVFSCTAGNNTHIHLCKIRALPRVTQQSEKAIS